MSLLIYSGLLYLIGVSIVLYLKPDVMFNKEGEWKEFGLGRDTDRYTWLPFWLFTILWAILSYLIVITFHGEAPEGGVSLAVPNYSVEPDNVSVKSLPSLVKKKPMEGEMKKGYYILDMNETAKKGIPKYIYLGPEAPNLVFNDSLGSIE